jgi:hypothetical protein
MKWSIEHAQGVIDVAECNRHINDGIGGHLDHVQCKKWRKFALNQEEQGDTTEVYTGSPE